MSDVLSGDAPGLDPEPVYELPAGIPRDGADELPAEPLENDDPQPAAQPAAAAAPAAAPAAPAAPPAAPAADPNADLLNHPLVRRVLEDNQRLMREIQQARQPQPEPEAPPERDPADVALEERMLQRIPWLAAVRDLFTNQQQLQLMQQLITAAPQFSATVASHGDQVAEAALDRVITMYAERRGVEKGTVDLPTQQFLVQNLLRDIESDPRLAARFMGGDLRVVDEVMGRQLGYFGLSAPPAGPAAGVPTAQPAAIAAVAQRVAGASRLPRVGAGAVPPPASPAAATVDPNDEDAVHAAGWAAVRAARR